MAGTAKDRETAQPGSGGEARGEASRRDELERTAADLRELVATLPDTYVYIDASDVVGRIAGARSPGHGVPRAFTRDGVGEPLWTSLPEDAAGKLRQAAALARATGKPVTAEIASVTPASILYDEVRHFPRDDGGLMLIVRDITENRRAAEALRRSEEKYRTLYLHTPVMLHSIDGEGRLLSVSDRWLQRLGYTRDEVLGRHGPTSSPRSRSAARWRSHSRTLLRHRVRRGRRSRWSPRTAPSSTSSSPPPRSATAAAT